MILPRLTRSQIFGLTRAYAGIWEIRNRWTAVRVFEIMKVFGVQPKGVSFIRLKFYFCHASFAVGFVMRLADKFRRGIFPSC